MTILWLRALIARLPERLAGAIAGVALTIALIGALGVQIASSSATMTRQAIAGVGVDWQVQTNHGASVASVRAAIAKATPYTALKAVWYADVPGFVAHSGGGNTQTTGSGVAVGLQPGYFAAFPAEVRWNIGRHDGALLFGQTASNLHATVGDTITVRRAGLPPARIVVAGIVAMPDIDAFFQAVGLPAGSAPQAPPDNVVLLPASQWHALFNRQTLHLPDSTRTQLHVRVAHDTLPADPLAAYDRVTSAAKNVEARIAGSGIVGDNLAARLLGAQADALYARVLFLFLGVPGIVLAIVLTFTIAASGATRRRNEQALLRVRGASAGQILTLASVEAALVAVGGVIAGLLLDAFVARGAFAAHRGWIAGAAAAGFIIASLAILMPVWISLRSTVVQSKAAVGREAAPLWERLYIDLIALAIAGIAFWQTASTGYQVVLAPEGVPQATVHYDAFLAPLFLWIGAALLAARLWRALLVRGRVAFAATLVPLAGSLSGLVAASLARQHRLVTRGMLLAGLAFAFGVSTAVFNTTYAAQSRVDAELTIGADVAVTALSGPPPSQKLAALRGIPDVVAAEPMQHRFAFVGNDLQDLFGIDPARIGNVTPMSNAFFGNGDAAASLRALQSSPDGLLVSEETVQTYQLHLGDPITLRLQDARTHRYIPVRFHFRGITREFPTAPKDSFLVTNATYIAQQTHTAGAEVVLLRTRPGAIETVSAAASRIVAGDPAAHVTNILAAQRAVGSSLTAVDLHALTTLELIFAIVFVAAATGLMLALGFSERLRTFAILSALGAKDAQLRAFLTSEAAAIVAAGAIFGTALGFGIAQVLVKVLTGVFDPPPEALSVPWGYLAGLLLAAAASSAIAVAIVQRGTRTAVTSALRGL
ncbi:MAG: FtsX-like permease family protein [Candidatus Eremiobacteraeota bacterium]|nr:FtsX-like permease family protein [Candidatus Eremiobacteraeota bacterium]